MDIVPISEWSDEKEVCKNCEGDVIATWYATGDGPICDDCKRDFYEECPCCDGYRQNVNFNAKRTASKLNEEEKDAILEITPIIKLEDSLVEKKIEQKGW
jgi:predicted amidophosphoribosyltransferase